jgi:hypothetical protein
MTEQPQQQQSSHPLVERFPMNATSTEPHLVQRYFQNRAIQLLASGTLLPLSL